MSRQTGDIDAVRHFVSHVMYFTFENVLLFSVCTGDDFYSKCKVSHMYARGITFYCVDYISSVQGD